MKKYLIVAVASIVVGWIAFAALVGLDTADLVAYNKVDRHVGTSTYRAGDLVSVSPDKQRIDFLCNMEVAEEELAAARVRKSYANGLEESLPAFAQAVTWTKSILGGGNVAAPTPVTTAARIDFDGRVLTLPAAQQSPNMQQSCTCAVAAKMVQRNSICMVQKSLNEFVVINDANGSRVIEERTVGASFRNGSVFIPDVQALNCPNISAAASIPPLDQTCPGPETMNNVWLRAKLKVIREYEIEDVAAAVQSNWGG